MKIKFLTAKTFQLISYVSMILVFLTSTFCFSQSGYVNKNIEIETLTSQMNNLGSDYVFSTMAFGNGESKPAEDYYTSHYPNNFSVDKMHMLTVSDKNGIAEFSSSFNSLNLPFKTTVTTSRVYTNDPNYISFETILINLYKYRSKQDEIKYDDKVFDGFIYIPDFFADYIIENDLGINSYDDLLTKANNNSFNIFYGDKLFKYRIANIFHIKGFNLDYTDLDDYNYTDNGNGKRMSLCVGNFCFISNYQRIKNIRSDIYFSITTSIKHKKYIISDYFDEMVDFVSSSDERTLNSNKIYLIDNNNKLMAYEKNDEFNNVYFYGQYSDWNNLYILLIFIVLIFMVSFVLAIERQDDTKQLKKFSLVSFGGASFILIMAFIFKKCLFNNFEIMSFFNGLSLALVAWMASINILLFIYLSLSNKDAKKENAE